MTGHRAGVVAKVKNVSHPDIMFTHCIIHREHLVAKKMSPELNKVLSDVIKIINEIRHKALNFWIFETLCEEMGSHYTHLLLHAEVFITQQHLQSLTEYFDFYYSSEKDPRPRNMWIIDPFVANIEESKLSMNEKKNLIDLSCDNSLKVKFQSSLSRPHFWLSVKNEYLSLSGKQWKFWSNFQQHIYGRRHFHLSQ